MKTCMVLNSLGIIIDTGVFFSFYNQKDKNHERSKTIIRDILKGMYGQPLLLDYIFDELMTLIQYRTKRNDLATRIGTAILKHNVYYLTQITPNAFRKAWELFSNQKERKSLSFTDAILVAMARELSIRRISSFDNLLKLIHVKNFS